MMMYCGDIFIITQAFLGFQWHSLFFNFSYMGQGKFSSSGFLYLLYNISLQSHMIL